MNTILQPCATGKSRSKSGRPGSNRTSSEAGLLPLAFTLLELTAVIAIVGLLTALLIPVVSLAKRSARATS